MAVVRQWGLEVHHITVFDAQFVPPVVSQIEQLPSPAQPSMINDASDDFAVFVPARPLGRVQAGLELFLQAAPLFWVAAPCGLNQPAYEKCGITVVQRLAESRRRPAL